MEYSYFTQVPGTSNLEESSGLRHELTRFYHSKRVQSFYCVLVGLCLFSLVWTIFNVGLIAAEPWFIVLQFVGFLVLLIEVALRLYLVGIRKFCSGALNVLDFIVVGFCVVLIGTFFFISEELGEILVYVGYSLLCIRNVVLVIRLYIVFKKEKRERVGSFNLDIMYPSDDIMQEYLIGSHAKEQGPSQKIGKVNSSVF